MRYLSLLLLAISLYSCSPQRQLNRLHRKHPELFKKDSVIIHDTIKMASYSMDTIIENVIGDTVVVQDTAIKIVYYNDGKKVYIKGTCKEKLIPYEKKVYIDKPVITKEIKPWYVKYLWWWLLLTLSVIIGRFAWNLIIKSIKPI